MGVDLFSGAYRACLFDLDGVLTDTASIHAKAWKQAFDSFLASWCQMHAEIPTPSEGEPSEPLRPFDLRDDYDAYVDGRPREAGARAFLESRGLDVPFGDPAEGTDALTVCGVAARKDALFLEMLGEEHIVVFPDSMALLEAAVAGGFAVAVISSSANTRQVLEAAGIASYFPVVVDGILAKTLQLHGKPAPDTYLEAALELGVLPAEAVVFEDAMAGVEAGHAGGFGLVVGVARHGQGERLLRSGADVASERLDELLPGRMPLGEGRDAPGSQAVARDPAGRELLLDKTSVGERIWDAVVLTGEAVGVLAGSPLASEASRLAGALSSGSGVVFISLGDLAANPPCDVQLASDMSRAREILWEMGVPRGRALAFGGGPAADRLLTSLLRGQVHGRSHLPVPRPDLVEGWYVTVDASTPGGHRAHESLLSLADGRMGTRGSLEEAGESSRPLVVAANLYMRSADGFQELVSCPNWALGISWQDDDGSGSAHGGGVDPDQAGDARDWHQASAPGQIRRVLDLRSGLLYREGPFQGQRSVRFVCAARPGVAVLRASGDAGSMHVGQALAPALQPATATQLAAATSKTPPLASGVEPRGQDAVPFGERGDSQEAVPFAARSEEQEAVSSSAPPGGVAAAARQRFASAMGSDRLERLAAYVASADAPPDPGSAGAKLAEVARAGFDALLSEQRRSWAARWANAGVSISGDPETELAVRFGLFHLLSSVAGDGEAALGARGLSGPGYGGHVFWDADVFVLPCLAAIRPQAARAMLEYRIRRLEPARRAAAASGREGARFPWESTREGIDVTPRKATRPDGTEVEILTGELEEHITADVAWAASWYARWTGDDRLLAGTAGELVVETARYWASRLERDADGSAHIRDVIGPDEYHEHVDDNAFTNLMARWNLRYAASLIDREPSLVGGAREAARLRSEWLDLVATIKDGYDSASGLYEQFDGFFALEPLVIAEVADIPVAADVLLGSQRVAGAQVIKQADVLMAHHMIREEVVAGSLRANLEFYGPRCAHGSTLSPAIQAEMLARAGRPDEGLRFLRMASRIDLDDIGSTSAAGLHVASMGGVWQALAYGFLGLWPRGDALAVDPRLPSAWHELALVLTFRGRRVRVSATSERLEIEILGWDGSGDASLDVVLGSEASARRVMGSAAFFHGSEGWVAAKGGALGG